MKEVADMDHPAVYIRFEVCRSHDDTPSAPLLPLRLVVHPGGEMVHPLPLPREARRLGLSGFEDSELRDPPPPAAAASPPPVDDAFE